MKTKILADFQICISVLLKSSLWKVETKRCLNDKLEVLDDRGHNLLKKRSEIMPHHCYQNKLKLMILRKYMTLRLYE